MSLVDNHKLISTIITADNNLCTEPDLIFFFFLMIDNNICTGPALNFIFFFFLCNLRLGCEGKCFLEAHLKERKNVFSSFRWFKNRKWAIWILLEIVVNCTSTFSYLINVTLDIKTLALIKGLYGYLRKMSKFFINVTNPLIKTLPKYLFKN